MNSADYVGCFARLDLRITEIRTGVVEKPEKSVLQYSIVRGGIVSGRVQHRLKKQRGKDSEKLSFGVVHGLTEMLTERIPDRPKPFSACVGDRSILAYIQLLHCR